MANFNPHQYAKPINEAFDPHAMGGSIIEETPTTADKITGALLNPYQVEKSSSDRTPQPQEEFSNPAIMPGFSDLPKEEQLKRIEFSQFDPANLSPFGTTVAPGTYESGSARLVASMVPQLLNAELPGSGLLSRYLINPLLRLGGRLGQGTASNLIYQAPELKTKEDWKNAASEDLKLNALLEGGTLPFRIPNYFAEMTNPLKFTANKAAQIQRETQNANATMNKLYSPINTKYGEAVVTSDPKKYLADVGIEKKGLYTNAKDVYDEFIKNPTYKNLSDLKTQVGRDYARISTLPDKVNKAQLFNKHQNSINQLKRDFLSGDESAINQLNLADSYAANHYFPYLSTPTLRKIGKGHLDVSPKSLSSSIKKATEKTVGIGKGEKSVIPENHPLRNHLSDLNKFINFGNLSQFTLPTVTGAIAGEVLHPGLGGAIGGGLGGLGSSQIANMASKFGAPSLTNAIQNPLTQNVFNYTRPWWYGGGRALISTNKPNKKSKD